MAPISRFGIGAGVIAGVIDIDITQCDWVQLPMASMSILTKRLEISIPRAHSYTKARLLDQYLQRMCEDTIYLPS